MLFVFTVSFFLRTYGFGQAMVVAPNPVEALRLAAETEHGWMLLDSHVTVNRIERGFLAHCQHWNGEGMGGDIYQCDDCSLVYVHGEGDGPAPSATTHGFRAYCENLSRR